jgi:hypothetical protein
MTDTSSGAFLVFANFLNFRCYKSACRWDKEALPRLISYC